MKFTGRSQVLNARVVYWIHPASELNTPTEDRLDWGGSFDCDELPPVGVRIRASDYDGKGMLVHCGRVAGGGMPKTWGLAG